MQVTLPHEPSGQTSGCEPFLSAESLLQSVVRITDQRDPEALGHRLVETLIEIAGIQRAFVLRPYGHETDGALHCTAIAQRPPTTDRCNHQGDCLLIDTALRSGKEEVGRAGDGTHRRAIPVLGNHGETLSLLVIDEAAERLRHLPLIRGLAALYRNCLAVLHYAEHDPLTGLRSRKTLDDSINRIIGEARLMSAGTRPRPETFHWLGICDIDHFKRINDTYGHVFGDEVLLLFGSLMKQTFRAGDLLFRFGGEEFVVMLEPTTPELAARVLERFRAAVEAFPFPRIGRITASIGYVRVEGSGFSANVLGQADEALYFAKNNGRNRICSYESLIGCGALVENHEEGSIELF